jgi:hypothetical protein
LRAACDAVDEVQQKLVEARTEVERLRVELEREQRAYALARELLRRADQLVALDQIRDGVTLH